jgi:methylglutaconyl-CoA hydratase
MTHPTTDHATQNGTVAIELNDGIATVRFGHPKGNALPASLLRALADRVTMLSSEPLAQVIVLRSEGEGPFCAGASFDELRAIDDAASGKEFFMGFARLILAMRRSPKFIITRVQGKAVGGGVGIVAASDYAIARDNASVKLSELAVGIGPFVVGPVIEKKIGLGAFSAMSIDADWRTAAWAHQHGLYARLCANVTELDEAVHALARTLSRSNPEAMANLKQIFWAGTEQWDTLLEQRAEMSGTLVLSDFTRRAIAGFQAR